MGNKATNRNGNWRESLVELLEEPLVKIGLLILGVVALLAPGHGPFDRFMNGVETDLPPAGKVFAADFTPDGCAEDPTCSSAALLAVARAAEEPIVRAGPFFFAGEYENAWHTEIVDNSGGWLASYAIQEYADLRETPDFLTSGFAWLWDGHWQAAVFVLDPKRQGMLEPQEFERLPDTTWHDNLARKLMTAADYVGAIEYGENGAELLDWPDGARLEFNPKAEWYVNGPISARMAEAVRAEYDRRASKRERTRENIYEQLRIEESE